MAKVKAIMAPTECDNGKSRLEMYMDMLQWKMDEYFKVNSFTFSDPPKFRADLGNKYARVIKVDQLNGGRSVHTFVNMDNGDILKSGGWKAPAPNGVRGNIFDTDLGASVVNEQGANYLRGPRW